MAKPEGVHTFQPPRGGRPIVTPVVRAARFALAHDFDLACSGSKPRRELAAQPELRQGLRVHRRSFEAAVACPPHAIAGLIGGAFSRVQFVEWKSRWRPWSTHRRNWCWRWGNGMGSLPTCTSAKRKAPQPEGGRPCVYRA